MIDPFEQALAAVKFLTTYQGLTSQAHTNALRSIHEALQSAAQEQKDWRAIEAWSVEYKSRTYELVHTPSADDESKAYCVALTGRMLREIMEAPTRLAALSKAAEFCRRELEK